MQTTCEKCGVMYEFDAANMPTEGYQAQCTACKHVFFIDAADAFELTALGSGTLHIQTPPTQSAPQSQAKLPQKPNALISIIIGMLVLASGMAYLLSAQTTLVEELKQKFNIAHQPKKSAEHWFMHGQQTMLLDTEEDYNLAIADFQEAIRIDPFYLEARAWAAIALVFLATDHHAAGLMLLDAQQTTPAIHMLQTSSIKMIQAHTLLQNYPAYLLLDTAKLIYHDIATNMHFEQDIDMPATVPNNHAADIWQLFLEGLQCNQRGCDPQEAIAAFHKVLDLEPRCLRAQFEIALLQAQLHRRKIAQDILQHVLNVSPQHQKARMLLQQLLQKGT